MIDIIELSDENTFGFRINGQIEKADMEKVFGKLENKLKENKKFKIYAEVKDLSYNNISTEAMKTEFKVLLKNPLILANISKGVLVTNLEWVKTAFAVECGLIPTLEGESFSFGEEDLAIEWLKTDQRAKKRLDITFSELAETSMLKVAGGFALGLLTAGLFSKMQRKNIGKAVLIGSIAAGIPLGIKVLNNNRQLLGK